MKQWSLRIVLTAAVIAAGIWTWCTFFPNHEQLIRKRLNEVAQVASFSGNEAPLMTVKNCQKLASFCTPDVEITVEVRGHSQEKLSGREDLLQKAIAARSLAAGLTVEFLDINVTVAPDNKSAVANLTGKGRVAGESDFFVQELK